MKAYNAGEAKTLSGLYADQAVLLPPGAMAAKGNAAIQAYFAKDMAESAKAGTLLDATPPRNAISREKPVMPMNTLTTMPRRASAAAD